MSEGNIFRPLGMVPPPCGVRVIGVSGGQDDGGEGRPGMSHATQVHLTTSPPILQLLLPF